MKRILSFLSPKAPLVFAYMLQQFEYNPSKFIQWFMEYPNLFSAQKRGKLQLTSRAKLMVLIAYIAWLSLVFGGLLPAVLQAKPLFLVLVLLAPAMSALSLYVTSFTLQAVIINPAQNREIQAAKDKLQNSSAQRIAVMGSYGKTTMKELLITVLGEGKKTAATPGNKNILISHGRWINAKLTGEEDVLVFEYGEAQPGDIARFAQLSQPTTAIITGLAPAHLDEYASLEAVADDFAAIQHAVKPDDLYINGTSDILRQKIKGMYYTHNGLGEWKTSNIEVDFAGTTFTLQNGSRKLDLHTQMLGAHHVGPLTAVVAIAAKLGLTDEQITQGVAATKPYEHRMQPRHLHGAWIIDDTYNGNIEGMRAGLELLKTLPGQKKMYVTPGLVDQGAETEKVHKELGNLIATAKPDKVVLMQNSVTNFIKAGLTEGNYGGEVAVEANPLEYYTNIDHYLASGDVVLMQNDWPDSYK